MKAIMLALFIFVSNSLINISAQTYLAYNDPSENIRNKAVSEKSLLKNETLEKEYNWEFLSAIPESFDKQLENKASEHDFGKRVACLKILLDKYYVTKEDVVPGDPMMRTIVLKPNIYYSTRKLEKHLKRRVKDKSIKLHDARKEMEHILEVALSVIEEDENSFEVLITKNKNNADKLIEIFNQVKLYNIYL